jgi:hypothetical protein
MAQFDIDEIDEGSSLGGDEPPLSKEKVQRIAASKRILILTNNNSSFSRGDFISVILDKQLVTRGIVAKINSQNLSGIKIVKIYNNDLWKQIRPGIDVEIIRGDDSYFGKAKKGQEVAASDDLIKSEEDLYNETTLLEDDLSIDDNPNRLIKTDNIITVSYGLIEGLDIEGAATRYGQPSGMWAYQVEDNIWGEVAYGQNIINDYPNLGLDTKLTNLTLKAKYTIGAPFYSFIQPYIGYQIINASSPGAGSDDGSTDSTVLALEEKRVEDLKKNSLIFGVSFLKRLVPGWFFRADLGSDIINFGFALEF